MAVVIMPTDPAPAALIWTVPIAPTQVTRSEWTGARKAVILTRAARWSVSITMPPMYDPAQYKPWIAFIADLQGQANTFRVQAAADQNSFFNAGIATAAVAGDTSIDLDGLEPSVTNLVAGDYAEVRTQSPRQLVILTSDLVADGGGLGTINFYPPMRRDVADTASMGTKDPFVELVLLSDTLVFEAGPGGLHNFSFDAEEAL